MGPAPPCHGDTLAAVNQDLKLLQSRGFRYVFLDEVTLMEDFVSHDLGISAPERKRIIDRILSEIRGRMMEEIVLLETKKAQPGKEVFKLKFAVGEFDMVIYDPEHVSCEIYEIRHSAEIAPQQYRHLVDAQKCEATEFRFGTIVQKSVIYRGESQLVGDIRYLNVEEYLKALESGDEWM